MGYFSNGTEGMIYEEMYCCHCVHHENCAILQAHFVHNYNECNKESSILDYFIPRKKDGLGNEKCTMFYAGGEGTPKPDIPLKGKVVEMPK